MPAYSLEELKKIVRKIEFNKTEYELLNELIYKAIETGKKERERLNELTSISNKLYSILEEKEMLKPIEKKENILQDLNSTPIGAIDGSFQVIGGVGGRWYLFLGIAQVIARNGFTLSPEIKVDGLIEPIIGVNENDVKGYAEKAMLMSEMKATLKMVNDLSPSKGSFVLIDGPIIDPPTLLDKAYINKRVEDLKYCLDKDIIIVGFVKRIMGKSYLNFLKKTLDEKDLYNFLNDLDLLTSIMYKAVKNYKTAVYTKVVNLKDSLVSNGDTLEEKIYRVYNEYINQGLNVYYTYYKPNLRGKVYRIEILFNKKMDEAEIHYIFERCMLLINHICTLPGMSEPFPISLAHNKCNVRQGTAETLYYEIMTKAFSEGNIHLLLEM